jgi:hypothetical protein
MRDALAKSLTICVKVKETAKARLGKHWRLVLRSSTPLSDEDELAPMEPIEDTVAFVNEHLRGRIPGGTRKCTYRRVPQEDEVVYVNIRYHRYFREHTSGYARFSLSS